MRPLVLVLVIAVVALLPAAASAQPTKPVAVTLGYPAAAGVLWHLNDRLAVRPDVTLNRNETKTTITSTSSGLFGGGASTVTSTQTDTTWSAGLSLLVTLADVDDLRLYFVPRVSYLRATTSSDASLAGFTGLDAFTADNDGVTALGGFGAHYMLGTRAAVFAESGVQYVRQSFTSGISGASDTKSTTTSVGLRTAVGFAVYF
jgi:hypothetical protein